MNITLVKSPSSLSKESKKEATKRMRASWLYRLLFKTKCSTLIYTLLLIAGSSVICLANYTTATETSQSAAQEAPYQESSVLGLHSANENEEHTQRTTATVSGNLLIPANHRLVEEEEVANTVGGKGTKSRQGRQYDSPLSASSSGTYASISGDGAYAAQLPMSGSQNYGSGSSYGNAADLSGAYHAATTGNYHDPLAMARGYPLPATPLGPAMHHHATGAAAAAAAYPSGAGFNPSPFSPLGSMFPPSIMGGMGNGLLSGSMFPLMSKGFDVSEIVCTAVAVAIGAVIIGAPFILIYLFVMNQMNGANGGPGGGGGPSGGAISLTGPTSSTTVNGRKKRQTSLSEALFKQLSPLVNSEQVAHTFKLLMNSLSKYQM